MVMHFFGSPSPRGKKKSAVVVGDDESLDSVSLNDGTNKGNNTKTGGSSHDSVGNSSYGHNSFKSERSISAHEANGIDAKLLREERQLQKMIAMSKDKPLDKKVQKATDKRREAILKEKVKLVTVVEQDLINRCLGVDEDGYCLRHQDQKVRMGIVQPMYRFETISICQSCAFGAASGIEIKNHGQKDKTISHAVNGALVATGVKKKKKKIKGAFAANMNGSSTRMDLSESIRSAGVDASQRGSHAFSSSQALQLPSMEEQQKNGDLPNNVSQDSRGDLQKDIRWMEEVQVRVLQVNSWDNNTAPLKCHPNFAKFFRMLGSGIPVEEIKQMNGETCPDLLVLSLDPEKSLNDQINSLPIHIQERLRSNETLITSTSVNDDESKTVEQIYVSYLTQLHVFEQFLQEAEAGIQSMRQSFETNGSMAGSDISPMTNPDGTPIRKKKKLRLTKKIKRLVGATATPHHNHRELTTDDEASEEENVDFSESPSHYDDNPVAARSGQLAVGPVPLQPLPQAGLRRARRPNATNRRPRKPAATTPDRGVIQAGKVEDSPVSPLTPASGRKQGRPSLDSDPGRSLDSGERKSLDSEIMDSIMSTSTAEELVERAQLPPPPPPKESQPDVVAAPSDEAKEVLATPVTEKSTPAAPMVIKSFPSRPSTQEIEELKPPIMVLKSFPSRPSTQEIEELKPPVMDQPFSSKATNEASKDDEKETAAPPMVIKTFPSLGKRASNFSINKEEKKPNDPVDESNEQTGEQQGEEPENDDEDEEEKRKKEELRKAVEAMHQFKLGSYDDSFGSIPTTVLPDLHPMTGEPSIHSHLSSISSHSSDASSSEGSESESDSDSDDEDEDDEEDDENITQSEHEKIDLDEYIHLQDKLIDLNAELFEAKYLLENSQKREEALIEANKAKDRKIVLLSETIEEMQVHINTLAAQNAEAGKIMMELTATIEANKRQKLFRRLSVASGMGSVDSDPWEEDFPGSRPGSQHQRSSAHMRRMSGSQRSQHTTSYHRRLSSSLSRRMSGTHRGSVTKGEADEIADTTPMMIAVNAAAAEDRIQEEQVDSKIQEVPPSGTSNIRQVASTSIAPVARKSSVPENEFPPAANVREITPNNRRRVKSMTSEDGQPGVTPSPRMEPVRTLTRKKSHEVVIKSYEPSSKLEERRRRKRELEERLKISVARTSHDADELQFAARSARSIVAGGSEEEV